MICMKVCYKNNILPYLLVIILVFLPFIFLNITNAGELADNISSGGGGYDDCDPSTPEIETGCNGGGCSSYGGGDDSWGSGGSSCVPVYVSCQSEKNICGWYNVGTQDIACGGSCSAVKPADPQFEINGRTFVAGQECEIPDPCDPTKVIKGTMTCEGTCVVANATANICDGKQNPNGDIFTQLLIPTIRNLDIGNLSDLFNDNENERLKRVYLFAIPNIVKKGSGSTLYLMNYGVDYCVVKGDNDDKFLNFGLSQQKLNIINAENSQDEVETALLSPTWFSVQTQRIGGFWESFLSWFAQPEELTSDDNEEFTDPPHDLVAQPDNLRLGYTNISFVKTSKLYTETKYTIEKCYIVNHLGKVKEYIPSKENGDKTEAIIKIAPKFREI